MTYTNDKLIIVDLEATCSEDNSISRSDMEIIEIGASVVGLADFEILDQYQLYIRPVVTRELTPFCTKLTSIQQETVDRADIFSVAINAYKAWLSSHSDVLAWASWGNYDKGQFDLDCQRHGVSDLHSGLPHFNIKNLFAKAVGAKRMGLGRAIKFVGSEFEGRAHSGKDDALNMARLLKLAPQFGELMKAEIYDQK